MVWCDSAADQAKGGGEAVKEIYLSVRRLVFEDVLSGIEAGGTGTDYGDAQGALRSSDLGHWNAEG